MTEAIKSADNFQQICICCCCLYKWFQVNYKYKNQSPKIGSQRNHLQMWLNDTSLEHSKNHLSRKSRRNRGFSRGSHAKHLLEYTLLHFLNIYAALHHKGCHKLEHLSLVPGCSYVCLELYGSCYTCHHPKHPDVAGVRRQPALGQETGAVEKSLSVSHTTLHWLWVHHLLTYICTDSLLLQAGKANCLTWGCDSLVPRDTVGLHSMVERSGKNKKYTGRMKESKNPWLSGLTAAIAINHQRKGEGWSWWYLLNRIWIPSNNILLPQALQLADRHCLLIDQAQPNQNQVNLTAVFRIPLVHGFSCSGNTA